LLYSVCDTPPDAQANAVTFPNDISGQFLAMDFIAYSCIGDLVPSAAVNNLCEDNGVSPAEWQIPTTGGLPDCSKYLRNYFSFSYVDLKLLNIVMILKVKKSGMAIASKTFYDICYAS